MPVRNSIDLLIKSSSDIVLSRGKALSDIPLRGCKSSSSLLTLAAASNSRLCLSCSAEFFALITALAVAQTADANAVILAVIAPINEKSGIIPPFRSIVSVKAVLSGAFLISSGNKLICSMYKYLVLNLLQIKHSFNIKSIVSLLFNYNRINWLSKFFTGFPS